MEIASILSVIGIGLGILVVVGFVFYLSMLAKGFRH